MGPCWDESYLVALAQTREIEEFLKYKSQDKSCSERTLRLYRNYLWQLLDYFVKKVSEEHIKPFWTNCDQQVISNYYIYLQKKGNTPTTIDRKIAVIGSFFDYMVTKHYLDNNPVENINYGAITGNHTP